MRKPSYREWVEEPREWVEVPREWSHGEQEGAENISCFDGYEEVETRNVDQAESLSSH
jgi:hypothetical protein